MNFKCALDSWKVENLQGFIHYEHAAVPVVKTELTNVDGTVVAEISQGCIERHLAEGDTSAKYLYDAKAYDSDLELEDIGCDAIDVPEVESVTVYGKIPTKSVAITCSAKSWGDNRCLPSLRCRFCCLQPYLPRQLIIS